MKKNFYLARIDSKYCDYLRNYDDKIPYNNDNKKLRPFVGILFEVSRCKYFAPLSSPKPKHTKMKDTIDFIRIKEGILGAINLNNMFPVTDEVISKLDLDSEEFIKNFKKYNYLLKLQLHWLNRHSIQVTTQAKALYFDFTNNNLPENIKSRCCNFILLEEKCKEYNKEKAK